MTADTIARLKITLDDVKPEVRRRIEVPLSFRLDRLHLTIQAAMGWTNSHLFEIRAGDVGWGIPDPDWPNGPLDARKVRLIDVLEHTGVKTLHYIYDYGDNWQHTIKIERLIDPIPGDIFRVLSMLPGDVRPKTSAGGPATRSSWRPSTIPNTNVTPKWPNGRALIASSRQSSIPK